MKALIIKRSVLTIICIAIMLLINFFSSQNAEESTNLSRDVTRKIVSVVPHKTDGNPQKAENAEVFKNDEKVRSAAHIALFLALGIFVCATLYEYKVPKAFLFAFALCVLYALFDEIYQEALGRGRTFEFVDLLKDWGGSFFGISIIMLVRRIRKGKFNG